MGMFSFCKDFYYAVKNFSGARQNALFDNDNAPGQVQTLRGPSDYLNAYQLINYVGNATGLIAGDIASLKWELVDRQERQVTDVRIEALLNEPIPGMTWNSWIARSVQHLLLDGNVFWLLDQTNLLAQSRGMFNELKLLSPALVRVRDRQLEEIISTTRKISTGRGPYEVTFNNVIVNVAPENICHVQLPSPHNILRGMGTVQTNVAAMDSERLTAIFNNAFFLQGATMDYAVLPEKEMGKKEFDRFDSEIRAKYEGRRNLKKIFIAPPGSDIKDIHISQKDMQFIEQRKISRQDIYSFFKIPPIISGNVDLAQYDSSSEQAKIYYGVNLPRMYKPLEASITKVIQQINPNIVFRFIAKNTTDTEKQNKISADMFDRGAITGNEYRQRMGVSVDLDSATLDVHWIGSSMIPAEFSADPDFLSEPAPAAESKEIEAQDTKATSGQLSLHFRARNSKFKSQKAFFRMTKSFYTAMEARVLSGIKSLDVESGFRNAIDGDVGPSQTKQPNVNEAFDFAEEAAAAKLAAKATFTSAVTIAINDVNKELGSTVDATFSNPQVQLVVEKLQTRYVDLTINSRRNDVREIIQRGLDEGQAVSEIKSQLQVYFKTLNGEDAWRATRIARTEASYAWDQGADISYRDIGVKTIDVVGCQDTHGDWDCNKSGFNISEISSMELHPNHTGTVVPNGI